MSTSRFARLRTQGWRRALASFACATVLFLAAGLVIGPSSDRQEDLESKGTKVEGTVTDFGNRLRGPDSVSYRFTFDGVEHRSTILATERYEVGQSVTVFVDPSEPTRSTIPDEQPQSTLGFLLTLALVCVSFSLVGWGVQDLWRTWRTRNRSVAHRHAQQGYRRTIRPLSACHQAGVPGQAVGCRSSCQRWVCAPSYTVEETAA